MNMKAENHTRTYTGSLKTKLHLVPSHTKMDFTISQESFTQDFSRTTLEPYKNYKHTLKKLFHQETLSLSQFYNKEKV